MIRRYLNLKLVKVNIYIAQVDKFSTYLNTALQVWTIYDKYSENFKSKKLEASSIRLYRVDNQNQSKAIINIKSSLTI